MRVKKGKEMLFVKHKSVKCLMGLVGVMFGMAPAVNAQTVVDITTAGELQNSGNYQPGTTLSLKNDITLDKDSIYLKDKENVVVNGNGYTVTSANNGTSWSLDRTEDSRVYNDWSNDDTPADLTFENITFNNYKKKSGSGVFKLTRRSTLDLKNFTAKNVTQADTSSAVWGGLIELSNNGRVRITDSLFENVNIVSSNNGGGDSITGSVLYIQGNETTVPGASVVSLIENSKFINNSLKSTGSTNVYGGAIYDEGRIDKISNSLFQGNAAIAERDGVIAYGGAIAGGGIATWEYARRGAATIGVIGDKTEFNQNYVESKGDGYGGAIYSSGLIKEFEGTKFNGNYVNAVNAYGGAIASTTLSGEKVCNPKNPNDCKIIDPANIELIRRAEFTGNYVSATNTAQGGAVYSGGNSNIVTGFFTGNYALGAVKAEGGAVYNSQGKMKNPNGEGLVDKVAQYFSGEFKENYVSGALAHGGALYNEGTIINIAKIPGYENALNAEFTSNHAEATDMAVGGGIYNNGNIGTMEAIFTKNYVTGVNEARGGGLANTLRGRIDTIANTNFTGNAAIATGSSGVAKGGALFNNGEGDADGGLDIKSIDATFTDNYVSGVNAAYGGAFFNGGKVGHIEDVKDRMTFTNNQAKDAETSAGGAIYNEGTLGHIVASFINNVATAVAQATGGAMHNQGNTQDVSGLFTGNHTDGENALGGALYNAASGTIESVGYNSQISTNFENNHTTGKASAFGGALYNAGTLSKVKADFSNNSATAETAMGGAVYTKAAEGNIISGTFKNNKAQGKTSAFGGAVWAMSDSQDKPVEFVNSLFENNRAELSGTSTTKAAGGALGGAVYGNALKFTADGVGNETKFKGNTAGDTKNAVYVAGTGANVEFAAFNGGKVSVYDDVDGENYDMLISGDGKEGSEVAFYGTVDNVNNLSLGANSVTRLAGVINTESYSASAGSLMHLGQNAVINTGSYKAADGAKLKLDLAIDGTTPNVGMIDVRGDVQGTTTVLVNLLSGVPFDDMLVKFVNAPKDDLGTAAEFKPEVLASSYEWVGKHNAGGETDGSAWYLAIKEKDKPIDPPVDPDPDKPGPDKPNPDNPGGDKPSEPSNPVYRAEVAAYTGLQTIAVEQNRSIANSVAKGIAAKKSTLCYQETCGIAELMPKKEAWLDVTYENAKIDTPADVDAKISGTTLGIDFYRLGSERAGLFGAYRHGKYDFSGEGRYYAETGSDVTNKSWLGGAYYQYDDEDWKVLSTVFAGRQEMDIKTDNRKAFADTDAKQYGASAEVTKHFELTDEISLSPSLGLYYTMLDIDTIHDNLRKQAKFDTLHYLEAEAGVAVEYVSCHDGNTRRVYVKPSIIKTFADGGKTRMNDIDKPLDTFEERTLGRLELGGNFGLNDQWNGYAETGYTFGDNYRAYDFNVGVGYRF